MATLPDGSEWRERADVVEITDLVGDMFTGWPQGCRMIARREEPHPGAQLTFCDVDGHRFQVFATDLPEARTLSSSYSFCFWPRSAEARPTSHPTAEIASPNHDCRTTRW